MPHDATVPSGFLICPPLDFPLRLRGPWGGPKFDPLSADLPMPCAGDHFASVHREGIPVAHRVHEAVDLESGERCCVYAAYSGRVEDVGAANIMVSHQDNGTAFATNYIHVNPLRAVGDFVTKGAVIATVAHNDSGDHLHFELWHWVRPGAPPQTDPNAVSIDPTRMLARWERVHALDYAVLGLLDDSLVPALDAQVWAEELHGAYRSARLPPFESPTVLALAAGSVWRVSEGDRSHLLRLEGPHITVIDEAYGTRTVAAERIDSLAVTRRRSFPTCVVSCASGRYGVPLHDETSFERDLVDLLELAVDRELAVELDVRRSAFWGMDGSVDDIVGVLEGVHLLR